MTILTILIQFCVGVLCGFIEAWNKKVFFFFILFSVIFFIVGGMYFESVGEKIYDSWLEYIIRCGVFMLGFYSGKATFNDLLKSK